MHHPRAIRTRLFVDADLGGASLRLAEREAHYLGHVLRLRPGYELVVFNGHGRERLARVARLERKRAELELGATLEPIPEPAARISLMQALVKSDAMDTIVQKATELGVRSIHAFKSEFSVVKLDSGRADRRLEHWQRIARSACEQSGRHRPPEIHLSVSLEDLLARQPGDAARIVLEPGAAPLGRDTAGRSTHVQLLLGPEGGLSAGDLDHVAAAGFVHASLGPRILRADTAAVAACTLAQTLWGDLAPRP